MINVNFFAIFLYICRKMINFASQHNKREMKEGLIRVLCLVLIGFMTQMLSAQTIKLSDVFSGQYSPRMVWGVTPLNDGENFAKITNGGRKIDQFSFKSGQHTATLFDVANTVGDKVDDIDDFIISPDGTKVLVCTNTTEVFRHSKRAVYYVYNVENRRLRRLSDYGEVQNPVWSPDGNVIAFVRDNNVHLVKLLYDFSESEVTKDGKKDAIINGVPDWVNEEEFSTSGSLVFTADSRMVCWLKYDETNVNKYSLPTSSETFKYPYAGQENSRVTAWSYDIQSHQTRQIQLPVDKDGYVARIIPTKEQDKVLLAVLNRHQNEMSLYKADSRSTISQMIISDTDESYVKADVYTKMLVTPQHIVMMSDKSGFTGAYVYSLNGQLKRSIEIPETDITAIYDMDDASGDVYFQVAADVINRQVMVSHASGKNEALTSETGTSSIILSKGCKYFLRCWSDINTPYQFAACQSNGKELKIIENNAALKAKNANAFKGEKKFFKFTTSEDVVLNGYMIVPEGFDLSKRYPVVMFQYSGPGSQEVKNSWSAGSVGNGALYEEYLAQEGYICVCVDGRGTGGRGADFEKQVYRSLGYLESKDQVETALWLGKQSYVDASRIAIWGWSFGGFNTLMSMSEGHPVFKCGVAVAPFTSFKLYDTIWTERYMRTPNENEGGYEDCPMSRVGKLHGNLLLVHGLADDNVHPENTFLYTDELIKADKDFSELIYNERNHSIRGGNTRNHLFRQITNFLKNNN